MTENFTAPEGWVATQISEDVIVLKRKDEPKEESQKSKTWEEFCRRHSVNDDEIYIDEDSEMHTVSIDRRTSRYSHPDRNLIPSRYAKPLLALMQLLTIREKEYIPKGWEPNKNKECYFKIIYLTESNNETSAAIIGSYGYANSPLTFPTESLADKFLDTWRDLIEEAKILL